MPLDDAPLTSIALRGHFPPDLLGGDTPLWVGMLCVPLLSFLGQDGVCFQ